MADRKISASTELAVEPATGDLIPIIDVSDTTDAATGTLKKLLWSTLKAIFATAAQANANHSGDATGATALTIAAGAVTYAKMQDVSATDKLLGRATAGAGDVEEIACTAAGRALIDDAAAVNQRATLGLSLGSQVQAYSANLDAWSNQTSPTGTPVGTTDTQTLTNKRVNPRIQTEASSATPTPTADSADRYTLTALAAAAVFAAPTGTPVDGQTLLIRIKDNATARALSFNAIYRAMGVALPTTTVISKTMYLGFMYNSADSKWDLIAKSEEA